MASPAAGMSSMAESTAKAILIGRFPLRENSRKTESSVIAPKPQKLQSPGSATEA